MKELGPFEDRFLALIDTGELSWPVVLAGLIVALGIGALHALAPGHGKAVIAAWLVGAHGRARHAVMLGAVVAAMHTASVLVLGLVFAAAQRSAVEAAGPLLRLVSAVLVLAVGLGLVVRQLRRHEHGHHHHAPPPLSRRGLVLLGASGGLLPSPSAFLVLATALFTGQLAYGLALVAAFSVGLAAALSLIGLAVLRGRDVVTPRLGRRVARAVPVASAVAVLLGGLWLTAAAALAL